MNLSKLSKADLVKLQSDISKEMDKRAELDKEETRKKLTALASEAGYSVEDLFGSKPTRKRAPAKIKYRDPSNKGNTWSGRGRMPRWMSALVAQGKKKEDFAI